MSRQPTIFCCRVVGVTLEPIADAQRRTEAEFWQAFELARPHILGRVRLLDAVACAMRNVHGRRASRAGRPRMADFAAWATAAEPRLGFADGAFMRAYAGSIGRLARESPRELADRRRSLRALLAERAASGLRSWSGTQGELLSRLEKIIGEPPKRWPTSPRGFAEALKRIPSWRWARSASGSSAWREDRPDRDRKRLIRITDDRAATTRTIDIRTSSEESRRDSASVDDPDDPDDRFATSLGVL